MKRSAACSIACHIALSALAIASLQSPARAQSADLVLCDRLAADPADPDKPKDVKGTPEIAPSDIATAIKFCKIAAAGSRRALYQLGRAYAANQQLPDAIATYRKAIDKGSTSAMVELGVLLATGSGVAKDEAQARKLFERAAQGGNPRGASNLAALPESGGTPPDPAKSRALLAKAAEGNSAEAQYQLGLMLADGVGRRTTSGRAPCSRRPPCKTIPARWSAWGRLRKAGAADRRTRAPPRDTTRAAALGNEQAKAALKRAECSWVIKDKRGNVVTCL